VFGKKKAVSLIICSVVLRGKFSVGKQFTAAKLASSPSDQCLPTSLKNVFNRLFRL
jgi:hypothetical protein